MAVGFKIFLLVGWTNILWLDGRSKVILLAEKVGRKIQDSLMAKKVTYPMTSKLIMHIWEIFALLYVHIGDYSTTFEVF